MTLLQSISQMIDNISVTDRQEDSITASINNLDGYLMDQENDLHVEKTFQNGSYDRDTILRPLDDIDVFVTFLRRKTC
jgi:tRNA nucleotidyltransferase (CCA-adding enzyme)